MYFNEILGANNSLNLVPTSPSNFIFNLYSFSDTSYLTFVILSATVVSYGVSNSLNFGFAAGSCFNFTFTNLSADIFIGTSVFLSTFTVLYNFSGEVALSFTITSNVSSCGKTGHFPSLQQLSVV